MCAPSATGTSTSDGSVDKIAFASLRIWKANLRCSFFCAFRWRAMSRHASCVSGHGGRGPSYESSTAIPSTSICSEMGVCVGSSEWIARSNASRRTSFSHALYFSSASLSLGFSCRTDFKSFSASLYLPSAK